MNRMKVRLKSFIRPGLMVCALSGGIFFSGYLLYTHFLSVSSTSLLFRLCSSGLFDCDRVNSSPYASVFGVPLAAMGLIFYFSVLVLSVMARAVREDHLLTSFIYVVLFWISALSVAAILPLAYISTFTLATFCLYCMLTWVANIVLFLVIVSGVKAMDNTGLWKSLETLHKNGILFLGKIREYFFHLLQVCIVLVILSCAVLILSHYFHVRGSLMRIENGIRMEEEILANFYQREPVRIDLRGLPVMYGDPRAKVTIVEYFNFDCGVCRSASPLLKSLVEKYDGKVKLYLKNFPLDRKCNPFIREEGDGISCKAALVSIALRRNTAYKSFVEYLMSSRVPLSAPLLDVAMGNAGVTRDMLRKLMSEKEALKILISEVKETSQFNPDGTPTFVINGRPLPSGLPPVYFFDRIVQMEVNRMYCGSR
ncbi:MAG TPA: vitamin K epoxide reductase family protein [Spirochaetota bacterium]|nr:vitamin K epoxide reductase family protein [Spirochaetota bacterium]